ncbi:uncharacterized protein SCHCODRAFT_02726012, partial [Schizophyllum commune H4-8]|uniref:uncharacterized protein n=1 Tax=Schizophyllum commune (strain H4-8 / FGSC 9210) TaxID=578458 RepID=UPI00215EBA02
MDKYDDVFCGDAYQSTLGIDKDDTVLMFSIDGAQLYRSKQSDVWIAIWVIYDLPPSLRYLKDYVLPSFVIPGPRKPKVFESFLLPSLQHLAAIQQEGLRVWNGARRQLVINRPFV